MIFDTGFGLPVHVSGSIAVQFYTWCKQIYPSEGGNTIGCRSNREPGWRNALPILNAGHDNMSCPLISTHISTPEPFRGTRSGFRFNHHVVGTYWKALDSHEVARFKIVAQAEGVHGRMLSRWVRIGHGLARLPSPLIPIYKLMVDNHECAATILGAHQRITLVLMKSQETR